MGDLVRPCKVYWCASFPAGGRGYAPRVAKAPHICIPKGALYTFPLICANTPLALKILFEFTSNSPLICSANVYIERNLMIPNFPDGGDLTSYPLWGGGRE